MATYTGIIVYQLGGVGATHAQGDTIIGVYEMVVVDNGGTSASGASFADTTMHEGQYEYFNTGQSFTINGILYENVIDLDTGSIAIDGVTIDGARVEFVDPGTGQTVEHFIPLQADDADAYTVQAGDTITTVFAVSGTDADQLDYADMYTGYTPSLDYIVEGTSGADTIDASYTGDPEGDMVDASDAADGSDDDSIDGGAQDTMVGGAGSDEFRLNAGGNKIIYTGTASSDDANDVITWTGGGQIQLRDFGLGDTGPITDGDQTNNDFIDLSAFYSGYTEMRADFADDNQLNQSVGDFSDNTAISGYIAFQNSSGTNYMSATDLTYDNTNVTCFSADVRVLTMAGECRVDDIKTGELVLTMDHGYRPVRWVGRRVVSQRELDANPHLHPIRITKGALGNNTPCRDMIVSPQHRIYLRSAIIQRMTGQSEGLVAAKHLLGIQGVEIAYDMAEITYVHIMFDEHEVIYSEGAASESFYTGAVAMSTLDQAARREIIELFPELAQTDCPPPTPARPLLPGRIGRKIAARHGMNSKPLVA